MQIDTYIGLGSNQGDRELYLLRAIAEIGRCENCKVTAVSPFYETSPVGNLHQPSFYNAVIKVETTHPPAALLKILLDIETNKFGRVRTTKWGERSLDLDLLLYGNDIVNEPFLTIPHPRMHERRFVLQPLHDIAPQLLHPVIKCTVKQLLNSLSRHETVTRI